MSRSENDKGGQPVNEEDDEKDNKEVEQLADEEEEGILGVLVVKVHLVQVHVLSMIMSRNVAGALCVLSVFVVQVHLVQHFLGGSIFSGQVFHGALCQKMIL